MNIFPDTTLAILIGYVLDLLFGDPHTRWHPICLIGNAIAWQGKKLRNIFPANPDGEKSAGICLVIAVSFCTLLVPMLLLGLCCLANRLIGLAVESIMCYTILAACSLRRESKKVYRALEQDGLEAGRKAVSMIVGRDTEALDETGVVKAAVETVAENTSDGVIAPLLFLAVGGPVLGYFYKAVNTMDSMVGYKNEKYLYFGRAAAKLDDVLNFLPARISAVLMIASSALIGLDARGAARIWKRDRRNHASPNSAQTEAVTAGALRVQLAGDAWYFGEKYEKPTIGDAIRPIEREDIRRANRLMYTTTAVAVALVVLIRMVIWNLILQNGF